LINFITHYIIYYICIYVQTLLTGFLAGFALYSALLCIQHSLFISIGFYTSQTNGLQIGIGKSECIIVLYVYCTFTYSECPASRSGGVAGSSSMFISPCTYGKSIFLHVSILSIRYDRKKMDFILEVTCYFRGFFFTLLIDRLNSSHCACQAIVITTCFAYYRSVLIETIAFLTICIYTRSKYDGKSRNA